MHPVELLIAAGGILDSATMHANLKRRAVRRAVADGAIVHIARDRYALSSIDEGRDLARRVNGYLVHESAALHWGWEVRQPPAAPKVAVPRGRPVEAGVVQIDLQREDLDGWATNRLQTALMCAADLPFADALAVVDSALRHGSISRDRLMRAAAGLTGVRAARAQRVVALADRRAANPFESALRACAIEAGLAVVTQHRIQVGDLVMHADLANPLLGVVLEAESWEHHGKHRADFDRDCVRYSAMTSVGWRVLRFTWRQVMLDPAGVIERIRETVALAGSCAC